jgi:hypothetical protein
LSPKEDKELQVVEDIIWFYKILDKGRTKEAFKQDPKVLKNNYRRELRMSVTTERRIDKLGQRDKANDLFIKKVKIGNLEDIGAAGLDMWKGPANYLPIQAVIKCSKSSA